MRLIVFVLILVGLTSVFVDRTHASDAARVEERQAEWLDLPQSWPSPPAVEILPLDPRVETSTGHPWSVEPGAAESATGPGGADAGPEPQRRATPGDPWVLRDSGTATNLLEVAYGNLSGIGELFVAVGEGSKAFTSFDGSTWGENNLGGGHTYFDVEWANDQFVAVGGQGVLDVITSAGTLRTQFSLGNEIQWFGVTHGGGGNWCAVGATFIFEPGWIQLVATTSNNGASWTLFQLYEDGDADEQRLDVAYHDGIYVCVRWNGKIEYSGDCLTWVEANSPSSGTLHAVEARDDGVFVAVGDNGSIRRSTNGGFDWTSHNVSGSEDWTGLTSGPGCFVASGNQGSVIVSSTGSGWSSQTTPTTSPLDGATFGADSYLCVGGQGTIIQTEEEQTELPDLVHVVPTGWSDAIVVSNVPDTNTDSEVIADTSNVFIDVAWANLGTAVAGAFIVDLYLNDVLLASFESPGADPGAVQGVIDLGLLPLSAGDYELRCELDALAGVTESDETNNVYVKMFHVDSTVGVEGGPQRLLVGPMPSPMSESTELAFIAEVGSRARVDVFDSTGRRVAVLLDEPVQPGMVTTRWDGKDSRGRRAPGGTYWAVLQMDGRESTRKIVVAR